MNHPVVAPKTRKHLMVPGQTPTPPTSHSTEMVQRWVVTALTITIVFHLAVALTLAAYYTESLTASSQVGLLVITGIMGCLAVGASFAIHRKSLLTPWVALGLLPSLIGVYFCFAR